MDAELLPHLVTFAIAAERSSSAAARELGIRRPPSASASNSRNSSEYATLSREGGRVALNDAGRRLHDYARRILELTADARRAVTGAREEVTGELRLAASSIPGQHLLPHLLSEFHERFPLVKVRVAISDTEATLHQVDQGRAHLGLVGGPGGGSNLAFRRLAADELVLVVPKRHPWWRKKHVAAADLVDQPLIQRERGSASRLCFEQSLERAGLSATALNVVLELGSSEAVRKQCSKASASRCCRGGQSDPTSGPEGSSHCE